jgi:uncharacterized BrkB/YihY/UPF0761 family membrane protein
MDSDERVKLNKIDHLIESINKIYPSTKQLVWRSFLQGIFVGLGTTIGVSIILAILTYSISKLKVIPILKEIIDQSNVEKVLPRNE